MATIAEEQAANARARAEGYESAAHKEAAANFRRAQADPNAPDAAEYERQANIRAQAAGFANAAEQEMDANRRSIDAGFTSAVDQEIDANRRAREAGFLNAADLETYGAAGATRSTDPFLDPRLQPAPAIPEQFALGTANLLKYNPDQPNVPGYDPNWRDNYPGGFDFHGNPITGGGILGGPPNPTVPSFGYPGYQDWTRFMPTNFGLAEGGGFHYQPWLTGGAGMGGGAGGFAGPDLPPGYNAGRPGVTYNPPTGYTPPGTGGGATGNVTTDAQGNEWIMSNGQWIPTTSELGGILASGDTPRHPLGHYDSGGNWVGSEGGGALEAGVAIDRTTGQPIGQPQYGSGPLWDDAGNPIGPTNTGPNVIGGNRNMGRTFVNSLSNLTSGPLFSGVNAINKMFSPSTSSGVASTQPTFTGYPSMNATYPGITPPSQPVSVTPNIDYGPHIGSWANQPLPPGYGTMHQMQPGILNEAYAEAMGLGSEVDNSEEGGGWSDSAGFGIG
jgi:hypothetical protein